MIPLLVGAARRPEARDQAADQDQGGASQYTGSGSSPENMGSLIPTPKIPGQDSAPRGTERIAAAPTGFETPPIWKEDSSSGSAGGFEQH